MAYSMCCYDWTNETDTGLCPACHEHCEFQDECDVCEGDGKVKDGPEDTLPCPKCKGEGTVPIVEKSWALDVLKDAMMPEAIRPKGEV